MVVRLTGKTNHGKNRVRENGIEWEVVNKDNGAGRWVLKSITTGDLRNVHPTEDKDFIMEVPT